MTRLENVINQVKDARKSEHRAWIFDDNGNIKNNVLCCEALDVLEELKEYELNVSDDWINNFLNSEDVKGDNTYNWSGNISNDFNLNYLENADGETIMVIMVHLFGDIRGGYSDYFAVKFDSMYQFYELESATQMKDVSDNMVADLRIFSDTYNVYDYEKQEDVGEFYCIELEDLLEEIKNNNN